MKYVHEDREVFGELIERTAERLDRERFTVEKDYWVTHALYALIQAGFTVWFKGGTSLSKGFSLIQRFSEDLDIKLEHPNIPEPSSWTKVTVAHTKSREAFFAALLGHLSRLAPFTASREPIPEDDSTARNLNVRLDWPGHINAQASGTPMKEYVLLEIGSTRVTPHVERELGSWVHEELERVGHLWDYVDNRPRIRCLHPLVTLIEKLTILEKRAPDQSVPADRFIRHYEDAAWIARAHLGRPVARAPRLRRHSLARERDEENQARRAHCSGRSGLQPQHASWRTSRDPRSRSCCHWPTVLRETPRPQ